MDAKKRSLGWAGAVLVIWTLVSFWGEIKGWTEEAGMLGDLARSLLSPPIAVRVIILLVGLWAIWVYQYHRIETVIDEFTNRRKDANQKFVDRLQELHSEAVRILAPQTPIRSEEEKAGWRRQEAAWKGRVLALMEDHDCSKQEVAHVSELSPLNRTTGNYHPDLSLNREFIWLAERMGRIKNIMNKYSRYPTIPNPADLDPSVRPPGHHK